MDWYPLFLIFSFIVLKSIGFLMIMEQPGAIKSVTGNEKKELGSFLLRNEKTVFYVSNFDKECTELGVKQKGKKTKLKKNRKHRARNGLCQHNLSPLKVEKISSTKLSTKKVLQMLFQKFYILVTTCAPGKTEK